LALPYEHLKPSGKPESLLLAGPVSFTVIRYSPHALARMRQYRITEEQVLRVLGDPHRLELSDDRRVAERDMGQSKVLRVVYTVGPDGGGLVITAMRIAP
jgi:hypothetical protein